MDFSARWISAQPAELAKISIIIGISMVLSERLHDRDEPTHKDVAQALAIAAIPIVLILLQPDMGTVMIISASVVTMIAVSGAPSRWVVGLLRRTTWWICCNKSWSGQ